MSEVRITDPVTGAQKGDKLARFDLIPTRPLVLLAEHYGRGARKYEDNNWRRGIKWSLHYAALQRHLHAFWSGENEDLDPEMLDPDGGRPLHLTAALWHVVALLEATKAHPEKDDRYETAQREASAQKPPSPWVPKVDDRVRHKAVKSCGTGTVTKVHAKGAHYLEEASAEVRWDDDWGTCTDRFSNLEPAE